MKLNTLPIVFFCVFGIVCNVIHIEKLIYYICLYLRLDSQPPQLVQLATNALIGKPAKAYVSAGKILLSNVGAII